MSIDPAMVGYYINTINDDVLVDYKEVNTAAFYQFVVNSITIERNAIAGDKTYKLTVKLYPTTTIPKPAFEAKGDPTSDTYNDADLRRTYINPTDGKEYYDNGILKAILKFDEVPGYYLNLELSGSDDDAYFMSAELTTNDFISLNNKLAITRGLNRMPYGKAQTQEVMLKCYNCPATLYTFLKYDESTTAGMHPYASVDEFTDMTWTNTYTVTKDLNFVIPVSEIISTMKYEENETTDLDTFEASIKNSYLNMDDIHSKEEFDKYEEFFDRWRILINADSRVNSAGVEEIYFSHDESINNPTTDYLVRVMSVPMVKANVMKTPEDFNAFLNNFRSMYSYLKSAMENLVNNFDIDLKFFNTYGPARHFYYYDNLGTSGLMDSVNIKLHFGVKFTVNAGIENAVDTLTKYIIEYIESDKVSLINAPSLYISNLIQSIINDFESVAYVTFKGLNSYQENVQKFESEITDINVLEGSFATNDVVPEYLTVDQLITRSIKTPQVIIDVL